MTEPKSTQPEFAVVLRGYDRVQVDTYITRLAQRVNEARSRVEAAEERMAEAEKEARSLREQVERLEESGVGAGPPSFADLGQEVARVLQSAADAAEDLRRKALEEANQAVSQAQEKAAETLRSAEARASELEATAQSERASADEYAASTRESVESAARDIRARAQEQASREIQEAEKKASALVAEADRDSEQRVQSGQLEAERLISQAEATRRSTLADMEAKKADIEAQIERLRERRNAVLGDLGKLRAMLDSATTLSDDAIESQPAAVAAPSVVTVPAAPSSTTPEELSTDDAAPIADAAAPLYPESMGTEEPGDAIGPAITGDDLDAATDVILRKMKRALQDEQNLILDSIRQAGEVRDPAAVVPSVSDTRARLSDAVLPLVEELLRGAEIAPSHALERAGEVLSSSVAAPLHAEVTAAVTESLEGSEGSTMTSDRVSSVFRTWRSERLESLAQEIISGSLHS